MTDDQLPEYARNAINTLERIRMNFEAKDGTWPCPVDQLEQEVLTIIKGYFNGLIEIKTLKSGNISLLTKNEALAHERDTIKSQLLNLLALINRDGGQKAEGLPLDEACAQAHLTVANTNMELDDLRSKLAESKSDYRESVEENERWREEVDCEDGCWCDNNTGTPKRPSHCQTQKWKEEHYQEEFCGECRKAELKRCRDEVENLQKMLEDHRALAIQNTNAAHSEAQRFQKLLNESRESYVKVEKQRKRLRTVLQELFDTYEVRRTLFDGIVGVDWTDPDPTDAGSAWAEVWGVLENIEP